MTIYNYRDINKVISRLIKERIEAELRETLKEKIKELETKIPEYLIEIDANLELNHMIDEVGKKYVVNINTMIK